MRSIDSRVERLIPEEGALTPHDIHLFKEGTHGRLYERLGSHWVAVDGADLFLWMVPAR